MNRREVQRVESEGGGNRCGNRHRGYWTYLPTVVNPSVCRRDPVGSTRDGRYSRGPRHTVTVLRFTATNRPGLLRRGKSWESKSHTLLPPRRPD